MHLLQGGPYQKPVISNVSYNSIYKGEKKTTTNL